jgi:malate synthase
MLSPEALAFLVELHRKFEPRRQALLQRRVSIQEQLDAGTHPDFLEETQDIRESAWTVCAIPSEIEDRRVEITGPVDRKMIINALNSGANVYMADFEDSSSPRWDNILAGQVNLRDAVRRTITYAGDNGKEYVLGDTVSVLFVRPRGWHLHERHLLVDDVPVSGSLLDFGLFFFHNGLTQLARGTRPYFYLPKLENHLEARLWNDVFNFAQDYVGMPRGTIRATVLIENILAAFEMDEILWELKDHSAGLNCGRWDYIFSFIKKFQARPEFLLPDRAQVTMDRHFLNAYVELLIRTCHHRGIHAMGGMAAQIPVKEDPMASRRGIEKVRQDKLREVTAGHDGTWVAHPGLVPVAREVFDLYMPTANQIDRKRKDVFVTPADLLRVPSGRITEEGLRHNIDVGIQYLEAWLRGAGCVPIYHLMEDAATAEISRSQVWQWVTHNAKLDDGRIISPHLVKTIILEELQKLGENQRWKSQKTHELQLAAKLFEEMMTSPEFTQWLTVAAYEHID